MDINNFYLLLELPVDPPEENPNVINETLKKKQAEWSRLRNHPSKGTWAQKCIGLIPDIQKVMADDKLRRQQIEEARRILADQEKDKYTQIDRHLDILLSKGNITPAELSELRKAQSLDENTIVKRSKIREKSLQINQQIDQLIRKGKVTPKLIEKHAKAVGVDTARFEKWFRKKEEDRFLEIDFYLNRCARRGFITQEEISRLSDLYEEKKDSISKRLRCTISKDYVKLDKPKPLDKTIEKLVNDSLKIIGKPSLYDFLEVPLTADLQTLQQRAREKDAEVRKISHKDAMATASSSLAGQCMTIFMTEETRASYDQSLKMSRLELLNSDIDAAGISGRIYPEYMKILMKTAIKLGMDFLEAQDYIQGYCQSKKWEIGPAKAMPKKKRSRLAALGTAAVVMLVLAVGGFFIYQKIQANRLKTAYVKTLAAADTRTVLEEKISVFRDFLGKYPNTEHTKNAEAKIREIQSLIEDRDFNDAVEKAQKAVEEERFEDAIAVYRGYLDRYPNTGNERNIQQRVSEVSGQIEEREYTGITSTEYPNEDEQIKAYNRYLKKYPSGRYAAEVKKMISGVVDTHYSALDAELKMAERQQEWDKCIALCDGFMEKFEGTSQAVEVAGFQKKCKTKLQSHLDMADMKQRAEAKGRDYEGARLIYMEYLEANPELPSYSKTLIVNEIKILDGKIEALNRAEKEWEKTFAYSQKESEPLGPRISRLEGYLAKYPDTSHRNQADELLTRLKQEKSLEDEQSLRERETQAWQSLLSYCQSPQNSTAGKIQYTEKFIAQNPSESYARQAGELLAQLRQQKMAEDERLRQQQGYLARKQQEKQRISSLIQSSGGRFVDNGNDTITDKQTGLTWCMFDAYFELGQCVNYLSALNYVNGLTTGGYRGWRMPAMSELESILKASPSFPSVKSGWFWTSEVFWHGWNKKVNIYTAQGSRWEKSSIEEDKCGSVLAVRP